LAADDRTFALTLLPCHRRSIKYFSTCKASFLGTGFVYLVMTLIIKVTKLPDNNWQERTNSTYWV